MNVRVDLQETIRDGMEVVFKAPCDASVVTGLNVYYLVDGVVESQSFTFADANTNDIGHLDALFAEGAVVKVILDLDQNMAFVQNADTNAYLEHRLSTLEAMIGTGGGGGTSIAPLIVTYSEEDETSSHSSLEIYQSWANGQQVWLEVTHCGKFPLIHVTDSAAMFGTYWDGCSFRTYTVYEDKSVEMEDDYFVNDDEISDFVTEEQVLALIQANLPPNGDEVSY